MEVEEFRVVIEVGGGGEEAKEVAGVDEKAEGAEQIGDGDGDKHRRQDAEGTAAIEAGEGESSGGGGFLPEERGDEIAAKKKEDGDAHASGDDLFEAGVCGEDEQKGHGADAVEGRDVGFAHAVWSSSLFAEACGRSCRGPVLLSSTARYGRWRVAIQRMRASRMRLFSMIAADVPECRLALSARDGGRGRVHRPH